MPSYNCVQTDSYNNKSLFTVIEAPTSDQSLIAFFILLKKVSLLSSSSAKPASLRLTDSHTPPVKSTRASAILPASKASKLPFNLG